MAAIATIGEAMARKTRSDFSAALVNERMRLGCSRHKVADHCGVSVSKICEWEDGTAVPDRQRFKRLCGMFVRMEAHPPAWPVSDEKPVSEPVRAKEPERKPEPESFGPALKRIRVANRLKMEELGELAGVGGTAVANWESDVNAPRAKALAALYDALPELKAGVDAGSIKAPPARADVQLPQPQLSLVKASVNSNTAPEPEPVRSSRPVPSSIDDLGALYAAARRAMLQAQRSLEILRGQLADAQLAYDKAREQHEAALTALDAEAAR